MTKKLIFLSITLCALSACSWSEQKTDTLNAPPQRVLPQQQNGVWIDVRSEAEFAQGHVDEALNLPYDTIEAHIAQAVPDKNTPLNVYCHSGRRAEIALKKLQKMGYTQVYNRGAYQDLKNK